MNVYIVTLTRFIVTMLAQLVVFVYIRVVQNIVQCEKVIVLMLVDTDLILT